VASSTEQVGLSQNGMCLDPFGGAFQVVEKWVLAIMMTLRPCSPARTYVPACPVRFGAAKLLLAGRQALPTLHPLDQSSLGVANGAADLDVGQSITPHPRLRQPGNAEPQSLGRLLWRKQDWDDCLGLLGNRHSLIDCAFAEWDVFGPARRSLAGG
jgi:hypothetical protein